MIRSAETARITREGGVMRVTRRRELLSMLISAAGVSVLAACASATGPVPAAAGPTTAPAGEAPTTTSPSTAAPTAAAAAVATAVPNPASQPATPPRKTGGTLTTGMIGDLGSIDGHQVTQESVNVSFLAYDRLIDYDDQLKPQPMLAESWDVSSDLTQLKLNLRKGVQFHSGREFTSADVEYNLMCVRNPQLAGIVGGLAPQSNWWTSIDASDPYTVILKSDMPRPGMFDFLELFNILDKDTMEGPDAKTKAVGTGPFRFVEWVQGDHFTFTRNPNYWQSGHPYLDGITVKILSDAQTQIAALEAGALDLADSPPIRDASRLKQDPNYRYLGTYIGGQYFCIFIDTSVPPFDNKLVRQALNYALDRQRFADSVMLGLVGQGQDLPWPPQAGAAQPDKNNMYTFDLDKAKSLLASAGVSNLQFDILYHNLAYPTEYADLAQFYQADLAQLGLTANLNLMQFATLTDTLINKTYNGLAIAGGAFAHLSDSSYIFTTGRSVNVATTTNWSHYENDQFAQLAHAAGIEPDVAKRKQLYSQINDLYLDEVFNMPVALYPSMSLMRANVNDVRYNLLPGLVYTDAWLG